MSSSTKSLRITFDCIIFGLQRIGGISNYWRHLIEAAAASSVLEARMILPKYSLQADGLARGDILRASRERLSPQLARYLRARIPKGTDVFHTSYYRMPRSKVKGYVVSVYDFTYERYRAGLVRVVHSRQKLSSIRSADAVLCISNSTRLDLLEHCPSVDPARLHVIHLGVDHNAFFPDAHTEAAMSTMVLFIGQRDRYKRFDLAVQAIRRTPRLQLGVAGPPLTPAERDMLVSALGSRWQEFGPVKQSMLRQLYSSAYAFIFPSDYEGFGLPVLEAMACGCPVIAANRSSLPEVGSEAALYASVQKADAYVQQLVRLEDQKLRQRMIKAGQAQAASFTWSRTFEQTMRVYFSLLDSR